MHALPARECPGELLPNRQVSDRTRKPRRVPDSIPDPHLLAAEAGEDNAVVDVRWRRAAGRVAAARPTGGSSGSRGVRSRASPARDPTRDVTATAVRLTISRNRTYQFVSNLPQCQEAACQG